VKLGIISSGVGRNYLMLIPKNVVVLHVIGIRRASELRKETIVEFSSPFCCVRIFREVNDK